MQHDIKKDMVSLVVPVYNMSKYVSHLFDTILAQTYPDIQVIAVNDGSTDNSLEILESYIDRFSQKGFSLEIYSQENAGLAVTVRNGLQYVKGEYVSWPDSDDFYNSEYAIERMVTTLKNAPSNVRMVRIQEKKVDEETGKILSIMGEPVYDGKGTSLFEDCLYARNGFYMPPIGYMVDFKTLVEETGLDYYTEKLAGQDWQLYLPVLYKYRCVTVPEPLCTYLVRGNSHSRGLFKGFDLTLKRYTAYRNTLVETLKRIKGMPNDERLNHIDNVVYQYNRWFYNIAITASKKEGLNSIYKSFDESSKKKMVFKIPFLISKVPGGMAILHFLLDLRHKKAVYLRERALRKK